MLKRVEAMELQKFGKKFGKKKKAEIWQSCFILMKLLISIEFFYFKADDIVDIHNFVEL